MQWAHSYSGDAGETLSWWRFMLNLLLNKRVLQDYCEGSGLLGLRNQTGLALWRGKSDTLMLKGNGVMQDTSQHDRRVWAWALSSQIDPRLGVFQPAVKDSQTKYPLSFFNYFFKNVCNLCNLFMNIVNVKILGYTQKKFFCLKINKFK